MEQNRYEPPRAPVDPRTREPGSIAKAVAIGAAIDIGGTLAGGIVIGLAYSVLLGIQGRSSAEVERALTTFDPFSMFGLTLMVMGVAMSAFGGFQCAVIANRATYIAPGIMSLISVTSGAMMNDGQVPLPQLLLMSGLTVAAILGGASMQIRKLAPPARPSA